MAGLHRSSYSSYLLVCDLSKQFPAQPAPLQVLRGVSFEMNSGDSMAVLGPSGSGKSTLLNILGTLDRPTSGQVTLNGQDVQKLRPRALAAFRAHSIGFVFQDHHLLPQCTARENVLLAAMAAGGMSPADQARADELLAEVGLSERTGHLPSELSGGERQRVAIARALMNQPALLLCDEPTGNLDARTAHGVGELLVRLAGQTQAILIVATHAERLAEMLSQRRHLVEGKLTDGQ